MAILTPKHDNDAHYQLTKSSKQNTFTDKVFKKSTKGAKLSKAATDSSKKRTGNSENTNMVFRHTTIVH